MSRCRSRWAAAGALALLGAGCRAQPTHLAEPATFTLAPATQPPTKSIEQAPVRPSSVLAWAHIDQPDVLLDVLGLSPSSSLSAELTPYIELLDARQPVDAVLVSRTGRLTDVDPVFRLHFKEAKAFFARLATAHELREDGDRVFGRPKGGSSETPTEDAWECAFVAGTDAAVCGAPRAVDTVFDWLKSGPATPPGESKTPTARLYAYSEPMRLVAMQLVDVGTSTGAQTKTELDKFFADLERFDIEIVAEGERLDVLGTLRLRSRSSAQAQDLLEPPNPLAAIPETFHRIVEQSSVALFTPGGGAVPKWVADLVRQSQPVQTTSTFPDPRPDQAAVLGSLMGQPAAIGYGLRLDRARKALVTAHSAKDSERSIRVLDDTLEPQFIYALHAPIGDVEKPLRGLAATSNAVPSAGGPPRRTVRMAGPQHGLPKGSFFLDEHSMDLTWPSATGGPTTRVVHTLFSPTTDTVWGVSCIAEEHCIDTMKALTTTGRPAVQVDDELFHQPGIVAAGYVPSFVGITSTNRLMLRATRNSPTRLDVLRSIEHELAAPRASLPFVVRTAREGNGGSVSVRMRGTRDAFRTAFERGVLGSSWVLARVVAAVFGR